MTTRTVASPWSVSLRELLILVALAALACISLKYANDWYWVGMSTATMVLFMAATVVAFIDRGPRQAFAVGFVLFAGMYAATLLASPGREQYDPYSCVLPTTKLMKPVFEAVVKREYRVTGSPQTYATQPQAFRAAWANKKLRNAIGNGILGLERPTRGDFLGVAHIWWGLLLGYCGGRFARLIYVRREQRLSEHVAA